MRIVEPAPTWPEFSRIVAPEIWPWKRSVTWPACVSSICSEEIWPIVFPISRCRAPPAVPVTTMPSISMACSRRSTSTVVVWPALTSISRVDWP